MWSLPVLSNPQAAAVVVGACLLCAAYVWLVVAPVRAAALRRAAKHDRTGGEGSAADVRAAVVSGALSAPVWAVFCTLPLVFDGQRTQAIGALFTAAIVAWWASLKLLALVLGRGPLHALIAADAGPLPFAVTLLMPVVMHLPPSSSSSSSLSSPPPQSTANGTDSAANGMHSRRNGHSGNGHAHANGNDSGRDAMRRVGGPRAAGAEAAPWWVVAGRCGAKVLAVLALVWVIDRTPGEPYASTLHHVCCFGCMYCGASAMMDAFAALAVPLFGVRLSAHFDEPYLSASVTQFWAERWNITASSVLRDAVYLPALYGLGAGDDSVRQRQQRPSAVRRAAAVMAAFAVSGVAHELILRTVLPAMTFEWTRFFLVNGVLCVAESAARRSGVWWPARTPLWVQRVVTLCVMLCAAEIWFLPPVLRSGLKDRLVAEALVA